MVLAHHIQFAAQILGRHLHSRQNLADNPILEFLIHTLGSCFPWALAFAYSDGHNSIVSQCRAAVNRTISRLSKTWRVWVAGRPLGQIPAIRPGEARQIRANLSPGFARIASTGCESPVPEVRTSIAGGVNHRFIRTTGNWS